MTNHVCPECELSALTISRDDNRVLHCESCNFSWTPNPTTRTAVTPINAIGVGKILRRDGLHRDYGQDGPDLEEDGGPGHSALGSAMSENHNNYNHEGAKVVFVECDEDQTVRLVREAIGDQYGDVIRWEIGNTFILERS